MSKLIFPQSRYSSDTWTSSPRILSNGHGSWKVHRVKSPHTQKCQLGKDLVQFLCKFAARKWDMNFKRHCFEMKFVRFLMSMKTLGETFEKCLHKFIKRQILFHSYNGCGSHVVLSRIISWRFFYLWFYVSIFKSVPEFRGLIRTMYFSLPISSITLP